VVVYLAYYFHGIYRVRISGMFRQLDWIDCRRVRVH